MFEWSALKTGCQINVGKIIGIDYWAVGQAHEYTIKTVYNLQRGRINEGAQRKAKEKRKEMSWT